MKQGEFLCKDALFVKRKYVVLDQNPETGSATLLESKAQDCEKRTSCPYRFQQMTVFYRLGKDSPEV